MRRESRRYEAQAQACTICGEEKTPAQIWFLLAESHYEDKLRVLNWQEEVAGREGMHGACCPAHVEELVIHWMTTGSLNFPFAATASPGRMGRRALRSFAPLAFEPDTRGTRQVGELAVHRESMDRLLNESPDSLQLILDELTRALERESATEARFESSDSFAGILRPA